MSQTLPTVPEAIPETTAARLVAVDHFVTHDAWVSEWTTRAETYELVDGIPLMTPPEHPRNVDAGSRLLIQLSQTLGSGWSYLPGVGVRISGDPRPTYRIPDFALISPGAHLDLPLDPAPIALVVEALSPSTRDEDLGRKRRDYASVGIPHYLIIDRDRTPRLTLLTDPADGDYRTERSAETVTLHIAGHDIEINASHVVR